MDSALHTEISITTQWHIRKPGSADHGRPSQSGGKGERREIKSRQVHSVVGAKQDQTQTVR